MKCKFPFRKGLLEAGCGRCLPCRINRQRLWTIRLVLEAGQHEVSSFVTLTYDEQHYPRDGCVSVRDAQLFLKRLRRRVGKVRYYLVGEYGERNWRPHYHAALFGVRDGSSVRDAWQGGFVHISGLGVESAAYVAGYVNKGLTSAKGLRWRAERDGRPELMNLSPEFSLMSRRPGIGAVAAERLVSFYSSKEGALSLLNVGIASQVRYQQSKWAIGRYLREKVADGLGIDREELSRRRQLREAQELYGMDQAALNQWLEQAEARSSLSGLRAEARQKRKSLERKL